MPICCNTMNMNGVMVLAVVYGNIMLTITSYAGIFDFFHVVSLRVVCVSTDHYHSGSRGMVMLWGVGGKRHQDEDI